MLVRNFPRRTLLILLTASLTLAACNVGATPAPTVDVNAINTAAVATAMGQISAQLTQTALAAPTNTTPPTTTPLPLVTSALPTAGASPTAGVPGAAGTLPTLSFNTTPNTTQAAGFLFLRSIRTSTACNQNGDQQYTDSQFEFHRTSVCLGIGLRLFFHHDRNGQVRAKEDTIVALHSPLGEIGTLCKWSCQVDADVRRFTP